jgi:hypothetical protein
MRVSFTPEAELVSVNTAIRFIGTPALSFRGRVRGRNGGIDFMDDIDAAILIAKTGTNPAVRHLSRAHGMSVAWFSEVSRAEGCRVCYPPTCGPAR